MPFYVGRSISKVQNRNDDDREVNHHGRSIEVGEAGTDEKENDLILLQNINYLPPPLSGCYQVWHILTPSQVAAKDLVAVDEEVQQKALKTFYER